MLRGERDWTRAGGTEDEFSDYKKHSYVREDLSPDMGRKSNPEERTRFCGSFDGSNMALLRNARHRSSLGEFKVCIFPAPSKNSPVRLKNECSYELPGNGVFVLTETRSGPVDAWLWIGCHDDLWWHLRKRCPAITE